MRFRLDTNNYDMRLVCDEVGSKNEATESDDVCDVKPEAFRALVGHINTNIYRKIQNSSRLFLDYLNLKLTAILRHNGNYLPLKTV
jgi:hypothetical protein